MTATGPAVPLAATAAAITSARLTGDLLGDLGEGMRPATELDAYHVQAIAHPLLEAADTGGRRAGRSAVPPWSCRSTSASPTRVAGAMFQASVWHGGHAFPVPAPGRLGVECEIAVRMARDLPRLERA